MSTEVVGKCIIFDYDFSEIVYSEGVAISGGAAAVEEISTNSRNYADIRGKGRAAKRYKVKARSLTRDDIEIFLRTCNTLPGDAEFFPFDAERAGYIASGHASLLSPRQRGDGKLFYEAEAELIMRESWLYGPDQGISFGWYRALPVASDLLTNDGHERAPIAYMQCSGDYSGGYVEDLTVRVTQDSDTTQRDRLLLLCDKLLRDDIFELGWLGEARHSYEYNCDKSPATLSDDLHGLVSGGLWTGGDRLLLNAGEYVMISFRGPLPVAGLPGSACLELDVEGIGGGGGAVHVALETDLSDIAEVTHNDLVVGSQTINIPDLEGEGDVVMGIEVDTDPFTPFAGPTAGACRAIAVAPDGTLYVVSDVGDLWSWTEDAGWVLVLDCNLLDVSINEDGTIYGLDGDGTPYTNVVYLDGASWTTDPSSGWGVKLSVPSSDFIAVIPVNSIFYYDGSWHDTEIAALDVDVAPDGSFFYIGTDGIAYQLVSDAGVSIGDSNLTAIAAASATKVYAVNSTGKVRVWNGSAWSDLGSTVGMSTIGVSSHGVLAGSTTDNHVWLPPYLLLSRLKGTVNRYIAPSKIPWSDPDESFKIRVEGSVGNRLKFLQICMNNRYWY
jgi:hypothetical protein